jgi:peptidoglycan hydrolase CwlO-like protein
VDDSVNSLSLYNTREHKNYEKRIEESEKKIKTLEKELKELKEQLKK